MKIQNNERWLGAYLTSIASNNGEECVQKVSDHLKEGQEVKVKVLEVDHQGRVRLSIKEAMEKKDAPAAE